MSLDKQQKERIGVLFNIIQKLNMNIQIATSLKLKDFFYYQKIYQLLEEFYEIQYEQLVKQIENSDYYKSDKVLTEEALIEAIKDMIYSGGKERSFNPYEYI